MVLPSSWIVRIFCDAVVILGEHSAAAGQLGGRGAAHEIHADGADVRLGVRVVSEAQQQARLSDTRVADEHELEHVVVLLLALRRGVGAAVWRCRRAGVWSAPARRARARGGGATAARAWRVQGEREAGERACGRQEAPCLWQPGGRQ